ncbi:nuclear pore complex protein NUP133 [Trifolium repens]|nr:nuclear pore complex protein NUP133 [Trifolium repens]
MHYLNLEFEATYKDSIEGAEELNKEATSHLLSIVKRHGCYKVMCTICCEKCYGNIGIKILVGQFYKWIEYAVRRTMDQTWFAFLQNQRYYFY